MRVAAGAAALNLIAVSTLTIPHPAQGQAGPDDADPAAATVTQIMGVDGTARNSSDDVEHLPFGSVESNPLRRGAELGVGDELRAQSGETVVVLACSDTAGVTLEGSFRAVIMPRPEGKACFFDLFAGSAHVVGDTTTGLGAGDVVMGAERTHYALTVSRSGRQVSRDLQVFDGGVEVRSSRGEVMEEVLAGQRLEVTPEGYSVGKLAAKQIQSAARLYARVDASVVDQDVRPQAARSLYSAYEQVLQYPDSTALRLNLVTEQVRYRATNRSTIYQIQRAQTGAPKTSQLEATTRALSAAAYVQMGDEQKAASSHEALRGYDAETLRDALRNYRIDPEMIRRAARLDAAVSDLPVTPQRVVPPSAIPRDTLRVRAEADPDVVAPGQGTRIVVKVASGSGSPVAGAKVTVSAGGGAFDDGGYRSEGTTDQEGLFVAVWSCRPCAKAYSFGVEASKDGFPTGQTKATVRIERR